jgi:TolB-like protein/class 3 adenylate cyclase
VAADIPQRLAAILAADIAGYTRLMERDEAETVAAWRRARAEVIDPTVAVHNGRIVKLTGDGFLAEFTTAESAVRAALAMQAAFAAIFPEDQNRVAFRMGVNLGDVWVDAEDIYGAGVNIAARLEAVAEPGGVCVSGAVYDAVKHKIAARYQNLGAQRVKNVADPIQVWRVTAGAPEASSVAARRAPSREERRARSRLIVALASTVLVVGAGVYLWNDATNRTVEKSIAVLPFVDLSPEGDQAYFADGLSEELLNTLAQVSDLLVVARTSSFAFRDGKEDARSIGQKLSVSYLVEGSVRKADDDLVITAQLIRTDNQSHVFSRTYERHLDDILTIQEEIAAEITGALNIALGAGGFDRAGMTRNVAAHEALMKALKKSQSPGSASIVEVINDLRGVVQIDPDFGLAWLELYRAYSAGIRAFPRGEADEFSELAAESLAKATELAPDMPELQMIDVDRAIDAGDWIEADRHLTALLERQHSNDPGLMARYASFLYQTGRVRESIPVAQRARRLEPLSTAALQTVIYAHMANGEFDRALQEIERSRDMLPVRGYLTARSNVAWQQGNAEEYARQWRAYYSGPDYDGSTPQEEKFVLKFLELLEANDASYARQEVDRLLNSGEVPRGFLSSLAGIANHYGDGEWQAELLEPFTGNRTIPADWLPRAALYRETAAFRQRMERNGLAHYWRTTGKWPDKCRPLTGSDADFECF